MLAGFSQGACLVLEFAARFPRRYGAVIAFTGGLTGPPGMRPELAGSLAGTPVFLGAGDPDPHVPRWRVEETAEILGSLGADVTLSIYRDLGHTIGLEEMATARRIVAKARREQRPVAVGG